MKAEREIDIVDTVVHYAISQTGIYILPEPFTP
jgi:hypothetical protein